MSAAPVLFAVEDGIATLTLNRPDAGNAIDLPMARALADLTIRCQTDRAVRCVVLTGAGRLFCAGGDVSVMAAAGERVEAVLSELAGTLHLALERLAGMAKPLLNLINGPAAGAGVGIALAGDVVLCARSAHFTPAYGTLGLTPDGGLTWLLPRLVGLRKAQEIILTNRRIKAPEAEAIGMVTRVVDDEALATEGHAAAVALAASATGAIGVTRRLLHESFSTGLETQLEHEARGISSAGASAEGHEGLAAYLAKRAPDFKGA